MAHCGFPTEISWKERPATSPAPARRAVPMSIRHVVSETIVARIAPAAVSIANRSAAVAPERRRYMIAWRAPLPDSSASEPSGLKIRSRATKPGAPAGDSSRTPSAPGPEWRSHSRCTTAAVSGNDRSDDSTIR
jgi:hypothetical protein